MDTMEMMRHPEDTTNMRRQTVASYFRVCFFVFYAAQPSDNNQQFVNVVNYFTFKILQ